MQNEMHPNDEIVAMLRELVARQYAANSETTPGQIKALDCPPYRVNPQLIPFLLKERESILAVLRAELAGAEWPDQLGLLSCFLASTEEYIYRHNQFISLSEQDEKTLVAIYADFMADHTRMLSEALNAETLKAGLEKLMRRHLMLLQAFMQSLAEKHRAAGQAEQRSLIDNEAVCAEYSARAQLEALGIDATALTNLEEPILDVGCGKTGTLVGYLRSRGKNAFGIDRLTLPAIGLFQADWLHYDYQPASWGTIISHMAFSNHFMFHHLYKEGEPESYASKYVEILAALRKGGTFYYAPGLPFIEPLLPAERFAVVRTTVPIPEDLGREISQTQRELLGESALYTTKITRLV